MTRPEIPVAIGGSHMLEQGGLIALMSSLPGLRVVPLDALLPPQVLVWIASAGATLEFPAGQL